MPFYTAHLSRAVNLPCADQVCTVNRLPHCKTSRNQADVCACVRVSVCALGCNSYSSAEEAKYLFLPVCVCLCFHASFVFVCDRSFFFSVCVGGWH